jgi:sarcosine oxidase subunit beta
MMMNKYDVIIIGAGSVGVPTAMALAKDKKVLVIDSLSSPGQGQNKKAIGGIRATHSDFGKIKLSLRSIEVFSTWKEKEGDDIGWMSNGYSFPAYSDEDEKKLKDLLKIQKSFGLNINWVSAEEYLKLVPGIDPEGLRGATYSPEDGSASPMLSNNAFYFKSIKEGAEYKFQEKVIGIEKKDTFIVKTDKSEYEADYVINATGNYGRDIGLMLGCDLPIQPDSHEGAITEPVERFFGPMVVDMRPIKGSANYYFYQNNEGQVIFCITPNPPIIGVDSDSTSVFLPQVAKRMIKLYPRLANLKVRRTWRGQYPMTPDGFPIIDEAKVPGFFNVVGMCGQGFMLGPGIGELVARMVNQTLSEEDMKILESFKADRDFSGMEVFK